MRSTSKALLRTRPEPTIRSIRGLPVILDNDLAAIYGVTTAALNQAVKRNRERFPSDFLFQLTSEELSGLISQIVISKAGRGGLRKRPWASTEHGAIMVAGLLNSPRAVEMSIFVVRAFVRLRDLTRTHTVLARKLAALERKVAGHDEDLKQVIAAIRSLLEPPTRPRRPIGFKGGCMRNSGAPRDRRTPGCGCRCNGGSACGSFSTAAFADKDAPGPAGRRLTGGRAWVCPGKGGTIDCPCSTARSAKKGDARGLRAGGPSPHPRLARRFEPSGGSRTAGDPFRHAYGR